MSENLGIWDNRPTEKNLGPSDNQRRAESLNNGMTNVPAKVYQARKPSSSVHSND
jgi:hypothetical protein